MPSEILNIKTEALNKSCFCNDLTYNILPPRWIKPSVVNRQQTTDNSLRFRSLLSKKLYSEFNFNKSYLTKFYKACRRALRWCIVTTLRHPMFRSLSLSKCRIHAFDRLPSTSSVTVCPQLVAHSPKQENY